MAQLLRLINKGTTDLQGDTTAANITATKFVKRGYSNDNILLGGGGESNYTFNRLIG